GVCKSRRPAIESIFGVGYALACSWRAFDHYFVL
ncbi:S-adenosyl-methyltransferase MraW, partial [Chlamydia psittaci 06-1683]